VQLESHATPFGGSPQQRYATLHRAIEQGLDSDDVWFELASVSAQLGHSGEAMRCAARINNADRRVKAERTLLKADGSGSSGRSTAAGAKPEAVKQVGRIDPAAAPAASHAGPTKGPANAAADGPPRVLDHLVDAGQYLMHQHMPWLVLTTMLAFPLVVGLGGFLTAGGSPLLLAAIAALPGLSVLIVVAAMGHAILRQSSDGEGDVPNLPEFPKLIRSSRDFLLDAVMVLTVFFAGPIVIGIAGAPAAMMLPGLALGAFFAPLTFAMRQIRRDMRAFSPVFLLRAVRRCGRGYVLIAGAITLAFLPAALVAITVISYPIWVQIAVIGPLCVLPTFATTRLLGTWLDSHRQSLGYLMMGPKDTLQNRAIATAVSSPKQPTQPRNLRRPTSREQFQAPNITNAKPSGRPVPAVRPASAFAENPGARPAPRAIEGRRPATQSPAPPAKKESQTSAMKDVPDIEGMPGAVVISGTDRERQGAASRRS
jgi:hypothetical protein